MRSFKSIIFVLIAIACSVGGYVYVTSENQDGISSQLKEIDTFFGSTDKSIGKSQNSEKGGLKKNNILSVSDAEYKTKDSDFQNIEIGKKKDQSVANGNSLFDDGKPGISRAELAALHERQLAQIARDKNDPNEIVIPATESQPALTRKELAELHARQMRQIQEELNDPNAIVIEATENQPAVTRAELQAMHAEQMRQIQEELNDPDAIVIEATETQPAVTRSELAALHREQLKQMNQVKNDPAAPAIENEDGTIITNQELAALHEKQRYEMFISEFNGDETIIEETK